MKHARSPLTAWQHAVLQNAEDTPRTLGFLLGKRSGYRAGQDYFTKLIAAGYLEELPATDTQPYVLYRRTEAGAELAEQLRVMADKLGWKPT